MSVSREDREAWLEDARPIAGYRNQQERRIVALIADLEAVEQERDDLRAVIAPDDVDGHPCVRVEAYMAATARAERAEAALARVKALADEYAIGVRGATVTLLHIDAELNPRAEGTSGEAER